MVNTDPYSYAGDGLNSIFNKISGGMLGSKEELTALIDTVRHKNDHYLLCHDFYDYLEA